MVNSSSPRVLARAPRPRPLAGQQLTSEEWRAVAGFIQQLIAQRGQGAG